MTRYDIVGAITVCVALSCTAEPTRPPTQTQPSEPVASPAAIPDDPPANPPANPAAAADLPATPERDTSPPQSAKTSAPVTVTAALKPAAAALTLAFAADGKDIAIEVRGVDGLHVTSPAAPTSLPGVRNGQTIAIAVEFTAPAGKASNLVVSVRGSFAGASQARVQSFTVGRDADGTDTPPAPARTDKHGRPIKLMKAN